MARLSDIIEKFLNELMDDTNGEIEIQRNELAIKFNCVPSQINYVISTRFSNDRGYYVKSRRGGGGSISIKRIDITEKANYLMHILVAMGDSISQQSAEIFINNFEGFGMITKGEAIIMKAAVSDKALMMVEPSDRDVLRAYIFKNMIASIIV